MAVTTVTVTCLTDEFTVVDEFFQVTHQITLGMIVYAALVLHDQSLTQRNNELHSLQIDFMKFHERSSDV
jgi:hypothetical protein